MEGRFLALFRVTSHNRAQVKFIPKPISDSVELLLELGWFSQLSSNEIDTVGVTCGARAFRSTALGSWYGHIRGLSERLDVHPFHRLSTRPRHDKASASLFGKHSCRGSIPRSISSGGIVLASLVGRLSANPLAQLDPLVVVFLPRGITAV